MIPTIIIAGTHSGCGKTTIASALMSALCKRGLKVQPFKVGPDFIDPSHHTAICKRYSRNLDPYMMGENGVRETFLNASKGADIAVIEGVMGFYDGLDGADTGSTAHVSKILKAPVILVIDAKGSSRSVNAVAKGFATFDPEVNIAGVIFNRTGSKRHCDMIKESLELPSVGWIPNRTDKSVESRHLGLKMAHETSSMSEFSEVLEENAEVDAILEIAGKTVDIPIKHVITGNYENSDKGKITIGVACDEAFNFYYQDNFDRLKKHGAELKFFSPMNEPLPDADAFYFGGGYPELHMDKLETSKCRYQVKKAAEDGKIIYAECGGLTYLCERLTSEGKTSKMCGVVPADAIKMKRFQALGYVAAQCATNKCILPAGIRYRGHEFHYTKLNYGNDARFALRLSRGRGIDDGFDGIYVNNVLAGYTHAYFTEEFAENFILKIVQQNK
ncbi:cobyrinic acid a,c-diamide synthase [Methanomicrobium sp. W14]|uniref:cobyrinate a,c-diamide synthase n=1 Tax=Methanomicrobium sp. W14 TaxID=2817839 RepID=UPI001AEB8804|nr:cobyrinate a,c-diamide synthase [Methanomicrobium sp. W14]MBP2132762.1 cobyrinic acid a,c-diamide synthase [Methanomicrobium sp. W14]